MSNIRFGTKWARADYGLIVAPYVIPMPEPQTSFVDIPGRDGALDLSEAFGAVRYTDRIIPLTLYARAPFDAQISAFAADVHGRHMGFLPPVSRGHGNAHSAGQRRHRREQRKGGIIQPRHLLFRIAPQQRHGRTDLSCAGLMR